MVISLSAEETILWDQIEYSGNPADFVWVLPVPTADAIIEISDPVFFDEIDAQTSPRIRPLNPLLPCNNVSSCGGDGAGGGGTGDVDEPFMPEEEVTVFAQETIGPYETVIIGSENPGALRTWLGDNGYQVAPEIEPTLDHYIDNGSVFVVLRLAPDVGVQQMQPVRVRYPGYMAQFPLKMVTVGTRGIVNLSLWVIAEQRYEARNYNTIRIDENNLVWDWAGNRSNYLEEFDTAITAAGGRAWVVEHASRLNELFFSSSEPNLIFAQQPFPYVTRLRTEMLVENLSEDLIVAPAADSTDVSSTLLAYSEINRPQGSCGDAEIRRHGCAAAAGSVKIVETIGPTLLVVFAMIGLGRVRRRRKHRLM